MGLGEIVGFAFVAIFCLSALISLSDAVSWIHIQSDWQRKSLWASTVAAPIAAIALLGQRTLDEDNQGGGPSPPSPVVTSEMPVAPERIDGTPGERQPSTLSTRASPAAQQEGSQQADATDTALEGGTGESNSTPFKYPSPEIGQWAVENLLPRPESVSRLEGRYPPCVASVRGKAVRDVTIDEARQCYLDLTNFNKALLEYGKARASYIASLDEKSLAQPDGDLLNFLRKEFASFTDLQGADWVPYNLLSNRYLDDLKDMARLKR